MLLGEITYKVGQKHRLALPKKFRTILGDALILTRGYEGCLLLASVSLWEPLLKTVIERPFIDAGARATTRFLLGGASEVQTDGQGRFIVPASLYEYAGFVDEVVFVGLERWVEIWQKERWLAQLALISQNSTLLGQRLVALEDPKAAQ